MNRFLVGSTWEARAEGLIRDSFTAWQTLIVHSTPLGPLPLPKSYIEFTEQEVHGDPSARLEPDGSPCTILLSNLMFYCSD